MHPPNVAKQLLKALEANEYLADIFLLLHLDETPVVSRTSKASDSPVLLVPASVDSIFTGEADDADELLMAMLLWGRSDLAGVPPVELERLATVIKDRYMALQKKQLLRRIDDESDPQIAEAMAALFPESPGNSGLLRRMTRAVRSAVTTVLSVSRKTGRSILMRGRDLSRLIGSRIGQFELPAKIDILAEKKAALFKRLYAFKGGKGAKAFVGIVLAGVGFFVSGPAMAGAGAVLAIVDP